MKYIKNWFIVLLLAIILFSGCSNINDNNLSGNIINNNENKLKVGVLAPLSGDLSFLGQDTVDGINLRNSNQYDFIIEDDESCNLNKEISAINKLIYVDNVDVLIVTCSNAVVAAYNITKENNITVIVTYEGLIYEKDHVYQMLPFSLELYSALGKYYSSKYNSICIIREQMDIFEKDTQYFREGLDSNVDIVYESKVTSGTTDFKADLLKCNEKGAQAIFPLMMPDSKKILLKQLNNLDYDIEIIAEANDEFGLESYGEYLEGVEFTSFDMGGVDSFKKMFYAKYNRYPQFAAVAIYDAIDLIDDFRKSKNSFDYEGAFGIYHFDENGNSHAGVKIMRIENKTVKMTGDFE